MMPTRTASLLLALAAAGCVTAPPPVAPLYAFVVLGPDGQAVARAIVSATTCPAIEIEGTLEPMTVRAPARLLAQRAGQVKPTDFPVTVCERMLPSGVRRATIAAHALPLPKPSPSRIVVLGDTGCRLFANKNFQFWKDLGRIAHKHGCGWGGNWKMRDVAHVYLIFGDQPAQTFGFA